MCFTEFSGLQTEASRLTLCEYHAFYSVCGAATGLDLCESHVFHGVFGVAARSVRAPGLDMSENQPLQDLLAEDAAGVSHPFPPYPFLLSCPRPGRRRAVRRKPLNIAIEI